MKKTDNFFHILTKDMPDLTGRRLETFLSSLAPDFIAVRSSRMLSALSVLSGISYRMDIPVVFSMPFKDIGDMLTFLSPKTNDENTIFLHLQKMIVLLEIRSFRTVCPVCSIDKLMHPFEHELFKNVTNEVFTVKEASSCPDCYGRGYTGSEFLAASQILKKPAVLSSQDMKSAFASQAEKTSLRDKAVQQILKKHSTLKEMERILL